MSTSASSSTVQQVVRKSFQFEVLGFLESVFKQKTGCPRQSLIVPKARGRPRIIILAFNRAQFFNKLVRNSKHRFYGKRGFRKYARLLSLLKLVRAKKAALTKKRNFYAKKEKRIVSLLRNLKQRWSVGRRRRSSKRTKITRIVLRNVDSKKKVKLVIPKRLKKKVKKIVVYSVKQ